MRSLRNLRQAIKYQFFSCGAARGRHTLEALGQGLGGRALGGDRRVEDAIFTIVSALLVVEGHATDAARVHASPAATALQAAGALDGAFLLQRSTARGRRALVEGRRAT